MWAFVESTKEGIERAYTGAIDTAQRKMDELNRKQEEHRQIIEKNNALIQQMSQQLQGATQTEVQGIEARIEKLRQLNDMHQKQLALMEQQKIRAEEKGLIALGATDAEIAALKKANSERIVAIAALEDQVKAYQSVKDASQKQIAEQVSGIYAIVQQQRIHQQAIDLDKQKLQELMDKRQQASGADAKALDQEIASLKKSMANQEEQIRLLDLKRVKLEENLSVITATSEAEEAAARDASVVAQAEIQSLGDVARAQQSVTTEINNTSSAMTGLLTQFGGLIGVTSIVSGIAVAFRTLAEVEQVAIDKANSLNEAMKTMTQRQMTAQQKLDAGFTEGGVTDESTKRQIQGLLFGDGNNASIPLQYGSNEDQTASAYEAIAPVLKKYGIGPDDPRFTQLIGTSSLFVKQKMDPTLIRNVLSDTLGANGGANDLNGKLSQMSDVAGSPEYANSLGDAIYQHRRQAELGGLNDDDLMKMWQVGRGNGLSPEETGEAVGQLEQSSRRFVGKDYQERVALFEQLSGVLLDRGNKRTIEREKKMNPGNVLATEMGLTSAVSPTVRRWLEGNATTKEVLADMANMSPDELALISSQIGGGRLSPQAAALLPGWTGQKLPSGSFTPPLTTPEQHMQALADQKNNMDNLSQPLSPAGEAFGETMDNTKTYFNQNRDFYPTGTDPEGFGQKNFPTITNWFISPDDHKLTADMIQRSYAIGREYINAAKMLDDPSISPDDKVKLRSYMQTLLPAMGMINKTNSAGFSVQVPQAMQDLMSADPATRGAALKAAGSDQDSQMKFLHPLIDQSTDRIPTDILNNKSVGAPLDNIDSIRSKYYAPTTQPTTRPTTQPVSINYHQRIVNYGYSSDSLSGGATPANFYG